jgi:two-component system sensor kinase FixL
VSKLNNKNNAQTEPIAAQDLEGAAVLLESLVTAAVDAIIVIDGKGKIQLFSRSAERMFGYRQEEMLGQNINCLMPEPYRSEHDGYLRNYERTRRARIIGQGREVTAMDRDGVQFPVDLAVGEARIGDRQVYVGIVRDLRQRHHLESMLKQERRRAERVFDLVEVVIMGLDAEGHILLLNRKATELLGGERSAIGRYWAKDFVVKKDQEEVAKVFREIFTEQTESLVSTEYRIIAADGTKHRLAWQHQYIAATESGESELVLCSGIDITETHRIAKLLRQGEERLRLAIDQAPLGIATLNLNGQVSEANRALSNMLQLSNRARSGLNFLQLVDSQEQRELESILVSLESGQQENGKTECALTWGGQSVRAELSLGLIRSPDGEPSSILVQIKDKTAQLIAEAEVESMRNRLAHVHRMSIMGEMAAGIAHEINQPLGAIATYSDGALRMMAADPPKTQDAIYGMQQIGQQARRAADVIKRIRAMSRKQASPTVAKSINQVITNLTELADLEAKKVGAPLIYELAEDLPDVEIDEVQIQQVLLNLIRNSLDAFATRSQAANGVTLCTRLVDDGMVEVCVSDHGVGVPDDELKQIFEAFYTTKPDGMGMGLSICSTIIRAHHGKLWCEPNEDNGSRFIFSLPVAL